MCDGKETQLGQHSQLNSCEVEEAGSRLQNVSQRWFQSNPFGVPLKQLLNWWLG